MPTARHVKQPKIAPKARADIDVSFYGRVDAALKDLRTCSRQIGPVLLSMEDELRILERLYYKGKNQHRLAKFWKKVEEMRRFGKRIVEMQLGAVMDDLRYAFYGDGHLERIPSTLKKAWTQIPDVSYLSCMLDRVEGANALVDEARRRFAGVNRSLLLMMQTGAFLQFIVTLTAIVSRLDALSQEIQEPLYSWKASLKSLISVMKGETSKAEIAKDFGALSTEKSSGAVSRTEESLDEGLREDMGYAVSRKIEIFETVLSTKVNDTPREEEIDTEISAKAIFESLEQHAKHISSKQVAHNEGTNSLVKRRGEEGRLRGAKPKKKKKKDAIDDIFGGL